MIGAAFPWGLLLPSELKNINLKENTIVRSQLNPKTKACSQYINSFNFKNKTAKSLFWV